MLQVQIPSRAEILQQLERILHSGSLHGSESLRSFLQFVVTKAVDKQENQLKEYTIATEVFGRDGTFDPRIDSVVRVQAGRLRSKVQEYYLTEGKEDAILIELPKGHYSPSFSYLKPPGIKGSEVPSMETVPTQPAIISGEEKKTTTESREPAAVKRERRLILVLSLLCVALLASTLFFYVRGKGARVMLPAPKADPVEMRIFLPFWQDFLQTPEPILVAYSNTLFEGTPESGMKLLTPLDSVDTRPEMTQPMQPLSSTIRDKVITQHYTGVGEVMSVHVLAEFFGKFGRSLRVKRSLLLTWEDLKSENFIFLGSPAENLLLRDLPQEQEFVFRNVKSASGRPEFGIINLKPKPGEQKSYLVKQEGRSRSQVSEDYAVISLLKGLDPQTRLLMLAGITTYGTQAAAEYVVRPECVADLISHLNVARTKNAINLPPYFQVLIRVKVNGGVPVQSTYVTHHVLD